MTPALMILGTHSSAGKSLLVTAFCRILARRGVRVAPFKAQNMSNNAGVTSAGGEMGRAQFTQAEAAGIAPHTDMNPVLLKPETGPDGRARSQVILNGRPAGYIAGKNWFTRKAELWQSVTAAYDRLARRFDAIILEGAGSPAEINLKAGDIVNLRMARHAGAPCLVVGDIDRGGVFAALAGTALLLEETERAQIGGFLINKFRGDPALLGNATELLAQRAFGIPTLGIVPYLADLEIPDEDAVALEYRSHPAIDSRMDPAMNSTVEPARGENARPTGIRDIVVVRLPHIANFDEFSPFDSEPGTTLRYVNTPQALGKPHAIILPGTKSTLADLAWLRQTEFDRAILSAAEQGTPIVGICGGYQMLGRTLVDPWGLEGGIEGSAQSPVAGLGLLPVSTEFLPTKTTHQARLRLPDGQILGGYEIHTGQTTLHENATPFGLLIERSGVTGDELPDGARSTDGRIWGTYLHGIFENDDFRRTWLATLDAAHAHATQIPSVSALPVFTPPAAQLPAAQLSVYARRQAAYDRLADAVEAAVEWDAIMRLLQGDPHHA